MACRRTFRRRLAVVFALAVTASRLVPAATPAAGAEPPSRPAGYWLFAADGGVFTFGAAPYRGPNRNQGPDVAGMAATPSGGGYWMVDDDGDVFAYGDAGDYGSRASEVDDVAAFAARPQGDGYWMATRTGSVDGFGAATPRGGVTVRQSKRIVAMASSPTGAGYWMAGRDGGVFALGDAAFLGSMGGTPLNQPVVGMAATPTGRGYWLVAADGGIFAFGDAAYLGSMGGTPLNRPVIGMVSLPASAQPSPPPGPVPPGSGTLPPEPVATLVGAGDIAGCDTPGDTATASLLDTIPGTVFTAGDNVYGNGTASEFANCYAPTWGRHKGRTRPAPGNHDYGTTGAAGYFNYFGAAAGEPGKGWYSYDLGAWHVIVLNSNCASVGGCGPGSPQERWLRADLAASRAACTVAYWHHPRFSSGSVHGNDAAFDGFWDALYDGGADLVVSGHDHEYERFAPQRPDATPDPAFGIREFVVGTGGRSHYAFGAPMANSERRDGTSYGVLKLTLRASGYDWAFVPAAGGQFSDSGSGSCHGAPPAA